MPTTQSGGDDIGASIVVGKTPQQGLCKHHLSFGQSEWLQFSIPRAYAPWVIGYLSWYTEW